MPLTIIAVQQQQKLKQRGEGMLGEIAYDWNRSWSSGTLSMRLIWSYKEKVLLLAPASQSNQIQSSTNRHTERTTAATSISSALQEAGVPERREAPEPCAAGYGLASQRFHQLRQRSQRLLPPRRPRHRLPPLRRRAVGSSVGAPFSRSRGVGGFCI